MAKRNKHLEDWLDKVGARLVAEIEGPNRSTLDFYGIGGWTVIVQIYNPPMRGWEIYMPPTASNNIADTLEAAELLMARRKNMNRLTYRELVTVLAALRLFQRMRGERFPRCGRERLTEEEYLQEMDHFEDVQPLGDIAIDALCERLNCGKEKK